MKYYFLFFLIFVVLFTGCTQNTEQQEKPINESNEINEIDLNKDIEIKLIKFHGNYECISCKNLGDFADLTIKQYFPEEYNSKISYKSINAQKNPNDPYVLKYQPKYAQLIMITINGNEEKVEELSEAWYYTSNYDAYSQYLTNKIKQVIQ